MSKKLLIVLIAIALSVGFAVVTTTAFAGPLPNGTKLTIDQGVGSSPDHPCDTGSCFSMEQSPGHLTWTDIGPGTDGGLILGKDQTPGNQKSQPTRRRLARRIAQFRSAGFQAPRWAVFISPRL